MLSTGLVCTARIGSVNQVLIEGNILPYFLRVAVKFIKATPGAVEMSDFIKNLFNGILSFLTGTLSFLTGLIGGKKSQKNLPSNKAAEKPAATTTKKRKSSGYFRELDEADEAQSLNGNPIAKNVAGKISELAGAEPDKGEPVKTPEPVGGKKPAKGESAKTPEPVGAKPAVKVELVQTAEGVKAEPVKAPAANLNGQNPTETTFAPKYLAPSASSSKSRRRPGPNMNPFLDMARQVKTPG